VLKRRGGGVAQPVLIDLEKGPRSTFCLLPEIAVQIPKKSSVAPFH
jgi:hypothetical protein